MAGRKKKNSLVSPKLKSRKFIVNDEKLDESDESFYNSLKYPKDNKLEKYLEEFQICSQDKKESSTSKEKNFSNEKEDSKIYIKDIFQKVIQIFDQVKKDNEEMKLSLNFIAQKYDNQCNKLEDMKNILKQVCDENKELKKEVSSLKNRLNILEQEQKDKNLIINGINYEDNENLIEKVSQVFTKLNVDSHNIREASRLGKNKQNSPILVQLQNRKIKNEILQKRKKKGQLTALECGFTKNRNIYINEDLTLENQLLFKIARKLRFEGKLKYTWIVDGKIFVKKTEESNAIKITNIDQFQNI